MVTHTCDSAQNTGQSLKQNSSAQSQSFENCTCQSPYSAQHKEESVTQIDGTPDMSTPSGTETVDSNWFSKQDECMEMEPATVAKPQ
jgi:hypothetical protein